MPEITKISYGLTIGDLKFGNVRPGVVEATLKPGETMEQALDELDERLNQWHRKRYPHLYQEPISAVSQCQATTLTTTTAPIEINLQHDRMRDTIDDCQTLEQLKAWKEANPVFPHKILVHYNERLKHLSLNKEEDNG